jgi:branched-chain amino acid transport system substrate-binding protein
MGYQAKLKTMALGLAAALCAVTLPASAQQPGKIKVGLMLPSSGSYAGLGQAISNGFKLSFRQREWRQAG